MQKQILSQKLLAQGGFGAVYEAKMLVNRMTRESKNVILKYIPLEKYRPEEGQVLNKLKSDYAAVFLGEWKTQMGFLKYKVLCFEKLGLPLFALYESELNQGDELYEVTRPFSI